MAPNTVDDVVKETLVYQNTDYVLVESEINNLPPNMADLFYKLNLKGYHPVFAHPERYAPFQRQPERIEELVHQSVYLQVNAGSLLGGYGHRIADVAWGLVEAGFAHFVASDTHCHSDNYPLAAAAEMIRDRIDERTARLLTEENPRKLLHNEDIDYVYLRFVPEKHRTFWQRLGDAMWNR
jgi:protein-tyrosine phosphatase